jgi:hypothetical protein
MCDDVLGFLVNSSGESINIINKNTEVLIDTSKEDGLEVNAEETNHIFVSRHQTTGQNHYIRVANKYFNKVYTFGNDGNK